MPKYLVTSELKKLKASKVLYITILLLIIGVFFSILTFKSSESALFFENWRAEAEEDLYMVTQDLMRAEENKSTSKSVIADLLVEKAILEYRLENDIPPAGEGLSTPNFLYRTPYFFLFLQVLIIVIVTSFVTQEYENKTIYSTLSFPVKRWKIYMGKVSALMLSTIALVIVSVAFLLLAGLIFYDADGFLAKHLSYVNGAVSEQLFILRILQKFAYWIVSLCFLCAFTVFVSVITKSGMLSIIVGLMLVGSSTALTMLFEEAVQSLSFLPITHMSYDIFTGNSSLYQNGVSFSIIMLILYTIAFIVGGAIYFEKSEVNT